METNSDFESEVESLEEEKEAVSEADELMDRFDRAVAEADELASNGIWPSKCFSQVVEILPSEAEEQYPIINSIWQRFLRLSKEDSIHPYVRLCIVEVLNPLLIHVGREFSLDNRGMGIVDRLQFQLAKSRSHTIATKSSDENITKHVLNLKLGVN